MFGDAADTLTALTGSERGSAFGYPRPMGTRSHSLALRANPRPPITNPLSTAPVSYSIFALMILLLVVLLGGCRSNSSSTKAPDASITESTPAPTSPQASDGAGTGRLVEFTVLARGIDTDQNFRTAGADSQLRYGNGRLTGSATINGEPANAELLAQVSYDNGSGPFTGFWTFTFGDGSDLALTYAGRATKSGDDTTIIGDLVVLGGTGSYASVTGGGTLRGERTVALGGDVEYRFSLTLSDLPTERSAPGDR